MLLEDWDNTLAAFVKVTPKDYRRALLELQAPSAKPRRWPPPSEAADALALRCRGDRKGARDERSQQKAIRIAIFAVAELDPTFVPVSRHSPSSCAVWVGSKAKTS